MDSRIEIWNVLHDGEITAITGEGTETLTMFVNIPYLRKRLQPLGDSFVLTLQGLKRFEFHKFDGTMTASSESLDACTPEILSTQSEVMPVKIEITTGYVIVDFENIRFALDTGHEVEYEAIKRACQEYWAEWEAKAKASKL